MYTVHNFLGYIENLLKVLFTNIIDDAQQYKQLLKNITVPESLCSQYHHPTKEEALVQYSCRFNKQ